MVQMAAFRGNDVTSPLGNVGADSNWAAAQNIGPITAVSLTNVDQLLLVIAGRQQDMGTNGISTVVSTLSGDSQTWVEIEERGTTLGSDAGYVWNYAITSGTPSITDKTFTNSNTQTAAGCGMMVAFKIGGLVISSAGAIASSQAFGTTSVVLVLTTSAIATSQLFGTSLLVLYLVPTGISSALSVGTPQL